MPTTIDPKRNVKAVHREVFDADGGAPDGLCEDPGGWDSAAQVVADGGRFWSAIRSRSLAPRGKPLTEIQPIRRRSRRRSIASVAAGGTATCGTACSNPAEVRMGFFEEVAAIVLGVLRWLVQRRFNKETK